MRRVVGRHEALPRQLAAIEFAVGGQKLVVVGKSQPLVRTSQRTLHHRAVRTAHPSDGCYRPPAAPRRTGQKLPERRAPHTRIDRLDDERAAGRRFDDSHMGEGHGLAALRRRHDGIGHPLRRRELEQQVARAGRILPAAGSQQQYGRSEYQSVSQISVQLVGFNVSGARREAVPARHAERKAAGREALPPTSERSPPARLLAVLLAFELVVLLPVEPVEAHGVVQRKAGIGDR